MSRRSLVSRCLGVVVYLAGATAYVLIANARFADSEMAMAILAVVSLACGWLGRDWPEPLLPFVLAPLALPFGYPESEFETAPVWVGALILTLPSAVLIMVGGFLHNVWGRRGAQHHSATQH